MTRRASGNGWLAGAAVTTVLVFVGAGYAYHQREITLVERQSGQELAVIARLKMTELQDWRRERLADVRSTSEGPFLKKAVAEWMHDSVPGTLRGEIRERLHLEHAHKGYAAALLVDPAGHVLLSAQNGHGTIEPPALTALAQAMSERRAILSALYRIPSGQICVDAVGPLLASDGTPLGAVILRSNATTDLYPMVETWPTPSASAETLLVTREGGDVVFLNELRHQKSTALNLRLPLTRSDLPAVQAVMGRTGLWHGHDYRGAEVLAHLAPIDGTGWWMVAKVDAAELLAEARARVRAVELALALLAGLVLAGGALLLQRRQTATFRRLFEAERARHDADALFKATLYSIGDGVITTDPEGRVLHMNAVAAKLTGFAEAEARGRQVTEVFRIINEGTRCTVADPVARVLRERVVVGLANHTLLVARDGSERPIADSAAAIGTSTEPVRGAVLVFRDQTNERRAEATLQALAARHQDILNALPDVVVEANADQVLTWTNPAGLAFFGQDIVGKSMADLAMPGPNVRSIFSSVQPDNRSTHRFECEQQRHDGTRRLLSWWGRGLRDENGRMTSVLLTGRDITEQRHDEERQQHAQKMESLGTLAGGIAHDFNNLLGGFFGYVQLAQGDLEDGNAKQAAADLTDSMVALERARGLTRQLLTFARGGEPVRKATDVGSLVAESARFALSGSRLSLALDVAPDLWPGEVDPGQIGQVIDNLVINARQAMPIGGELSIKVTNAEIETAGAVSPGRYVCIQVQDQGIGIPAADRERIFDPFFSTKKGGTGLGLTTAYSIVRRHGGHIAVASEVGTGTVFTVYLPAANAAVVAQPGRAIPAVDIAGRAILLMDDEKVVRESLAAALRQRGAAVTAVAGGAAAITSYQKAREAGKPFDIVILDLTIPGEAGGQDVVAKLHDLDPNVRAVATSGYANDPVMARPAEFGFLCALPKPHTSAELFRALATALGT